MMSFLSVLGRAVFTSRRFCVSTLDYGKLKLAATVPAFIALQISVFMREVLWRWKKPREMREYDAGNSSSRARGQRCLVRATGTQLKATATTFPIHHPQ
jgi:hypothetical protein